MTTTTRIRAHPFVRAARRAVHGLRHRLQGVIKNRTLAYERSGKVWKQDMLLGNERGGGEALFTTASDLLLWNEALTSAKLGVFVSAKLQEPATLLHGRTLTGAGRGLFADTYRGAREIWYSGSAAAYKPGLDDIRSMRCRSRSCATRATARTGPRLPTASSIC